MQSGACDVCTMIVWIRFRLIPWVRAGSSQQLRTVSAGHFLEFATTLNGRGKPETRGGEENILIGAAQRVAFILNKYIPFLFEQSYLLSFPISHI
jgi:hypothetical protein